MITLFFLAPQILQKIFALAAFSISLRSFFIG